MSNYQIYLDNLCDNLIEEIRTDSDKHLMEKKNEVYNIFEKE